MGRRVKWIAGMCTVGCLLLLPAAALAVFPGENGRIAFVSGMGGPPNDDSGADVYILDGPGDTTPTPLTSTTGAAGQHRHPAWSPRLDAIAYARWAGSSNEKIFIDFLDQPGIPQLRLGFQSSAVRDDRPAWNPAGTKIAYESEVTDGSGQMDILLATLDEDGNTESEVNLTNSPTLIEGKPAWSHDGRWIYYSRRGLPPATDDDIVRERSDNSSTVPQIVVGSGVAEYQPALAPQSAAMCFTRGPFGSTNADVFTIEPVEFLSGTQTDLSDSSTGAYNCAYSPEGDRVAFVEGIFTNGALRMKNSDDSGVSTLVTTDTPMHFDGNPAWAPKRPAFCNEKPASIAGTDAADELRGTSERNVIQSHKGRDTVIALRGNDLACAGAGKDTLRGNRGKDTLIGARGNDVLNGGRGRDTCKGGPGRDREINCER
jgi:Tol biopolymer transport system component